jgi:hypothetical protein
MESTVTGSASDPMDVQAVIPALPDGFDAAEYEDELTKPLPGGGRFADRRDLLERGRCLGISDSSPSECERAPDWDSAPPDGARFVNGDDLASSDIRLVCPDAESEGALCKSRCVAQDALEASDLAPLAFSNSPADNDFLSSGDLTGNILLDYDQSMPIDAPQNDPPPEQSADPDIGDGSSESVVPHGARFAGPDDLSQEGIAFIYGVFE